MNEKEFIRTVRRYYKNNSRELPWRPPELSLQNGLLDEYKILLSEVMLQQTQVPRVINTYREFVEKWPTITNLASASQKDVLRAWQGLGYNRRALYLHQTCKNLAKHSVWTKDLLVAQPGIGENTASAILVYAYNQPEVFIETNIRAVFLHHFFSSKQDVADRELIPLIEATLNRKNSREWYWALMDYGSYLKKTHKNPATKSKHHVRQSQFEGSKRQLRAQILRILLTSPQNKNELSSMFKDERVTVVLDDLAKEGFIEQRGKKYTVVG